MEDVVRHTRSPLVVITRCLLAADSVLWASFAVALWTGTVSIGDVRPETVRLISVLMAGNAAALAMLAWWALRGRAVADYAAVALLAATAVVSAADELGAADLAFIAFDLAILVVLIVGIRAERRGGRDVEVTGQAIA